MALYLSYADTTPKRSLPCTIGVLVGIVILLSLTACSSIRHVKPLDPGEHRVGVSVGGPLFDSLGFPIPIPLLSVDYQYGLTRNLSIGGAYYITPLLFYHRSPTFENISSHMLEVDAAFCPIEQNGAIPWIMVHSSNFFITDFTEFLFLPELGVTAAWDIGSVITLYTGATVMFNLFPKTAGLSDSQVVLPSFPVGLLIALGNASIGAEVRLGNPFGSTEKRVIHFLGIADQGAFAPFLTFSYAFGGGER